MNTTVRTNEGLTIVDVHGHIDLGSSPAFRKTMLESLKNWRLAWRLIWPRSNTSTAPVLLRCWKS